MEAQQPLQEVLRAAIQNGALPVQDPIAAWGSRGAGRLCAGCREIIAVDSAQIDLEFLVGGQRLVRSLHPRCWLAWEKIRATTA